MIQAILQALIKSDPRVASLTAILAPATPSLRAIALAGIDCVVTTVRGLGSDNPEEHLSKIRHYSTPEQYDAFLKAMNEQAGQVLIHRIEAEEEMTALGWKLLIGVLLAVIAA